MRHYSLALSLALLCFVSNGEPLRQSFRARLPLRFEESRAADKSEVKYVARMSGWALGFATNAIQYRAAGMKASASVHFGSAANRISPTAVNALETKVNDYTGSAEHWRTGVPCWSRVEYKNVQPGIDLAFYGTGEGLEYDAIVAPGADPGKLVFAFDKSMEPRLNPAGDLLLDLPSGSFAWRKPLAYQTIAGERRPVSVAFRTRGHSASFAVSAWDKRYPLVIDPSLSFSTYLGGGNNDGARAIAVDNIGNVYIAGATDSGDLPVTGASYQSAYRAQGDYFNGNAFVAKLNSTGTALLYITYLGGTVADAATGIVVDGSGNAYVAGATDSPDFPVTSGAFQTKFGGGGGEGSFHQVGDAFVARFDATGKLVWSTYLGGSADDGASAIALDSSGNVYVAGSTLSTNFPGVSSGFQKHFGGAGGQATVAQTGYVSFNTGDAFVAKLDSAGAHLLAATYLGGSADEICMALTRDPSGNIWVGGGTVSQNFPVTAGAIRATFGGASDTNTQLIYRVGDGFVSELSSDLSQLLYSTYLGGSRDDAVAALASDSSGAIYVAGATQSSDFPVTSGALSTSYHGPAAPPAQRPYLIGDAFVAKLKPGGAGLVFSTYLGGSDDDTASAIAVDNQGYVIVGGMTNSSNFPVSSDAQQRSFGGSGAALVSGIGDGFIARLDPNGSLVYSTYLGGSGHDAILAIAVDSTGAVYSTGLSASTNYPVSGGALQAALNTKNAGDSDAVVTKLILGAASAAPVISGVTNGASYAPGAIVPGSLYTIFGQNLTTSTGITLASAVPLATSLLNVSVTVNGVGAPITGIANVNGQQQINFQVPWEIAGQSSASVQVVSSGASSAATTVSVPAAQPGIFTYGANYGAILHSNYQLADSSHPATKGETLLIYCTGLGAVQSHPATGAPENNIEYTSTPASVTLAGISASVSYSGLAPGFVGLYQVNFVVPSGAASGNQPVIIKISGAISNSVLLPVQ